MNYSYRTISKAVRDVTFKEKGSKFISYAFPIEDEGDAKDKLDKLWEEYPDATHICYAWRLGIDGENYRANDDGEPSGSAGLPIYNQILSKDVTHVLVASVRYYGGTKLGVPGLVRAYKLSAQLVLDETKIVTRHLTEKVKLKFDYEDQGGVMRILDKFDAEIIESEFTADCKIKVKIRKKKMDAFLNSLEALYKVIIETENQIGS